MKIAVLSDPNNFHTRKWVRALIRAGAEVTVFSFNQYSGDELKAVRIAPPMGRLNYLAYLLGGGRLRRALRAENIDVVCALNLTPFGVWALGAGVRPLVGVALGADILEFPPDVSLSPALAQRSWDVEGKGMPGWKRWFFRRKVKRVLQGADMLLADNAWLISCMEHWFDVPVGRVNLLRWGVEPDLFEVKEEALDQLRQRYGIRPGQKLILSPRGAKSVYQADVILDAFAQLHSKREGTDVFTLMLSAGYGVPKDIGEKARALEAQQPNFKMECGLLDRSQLHALWHLADVMVSAPIYDGYSAALAEARYMGVVPVVNSIPANMELIEHQVNGWVTEPFTAEQLASDLGEVLADLEGWKVRFAAPNRAWIEEHSIMQRNAELFVEWVEKLVKERGRPQ